MSSVYFRGVLVFKGHGGMYNEIVFIERIDLKSAPLPRVYSSTLITIVLVHIP
jgi:hypothetical protein